MIAQKIGLFGGAFDPIHHGHLKVAKIIYETLGLDKLYFIPSFASLDDKCIHACPQDRLRMCKLACENHLGFFVSDYEINQKKSVYTKNTLAYFQSIYPNEKLFWIMGQDQAIRISSWHRPDVILNLATLVVYPRGTLSMPHEIHIADKKYSVATDTNEFDQAKIIYLKDQPQDEIASSLIKKNWNNTTFESNQLPKTVLAYIQTHNIYKKASDEK
jgi:nicotinate-nucleotide adenylyltransferase